MVETGELHPSELLYMDTAVEVVRAELHQEASVVQAAACCPLLRLQLPDSRHLGNSVLLLQLTEHPILLALAAALGVLAVLAITLGMADARIKAALAAVAEPYGEAGKAGWAALALTQLAVADQPEHGRDQGRTFPAEMEPPLDLAAAAEQADLVLQQDHLAAMAASLLAAVVVALDTLVLMVALAALVALATAVFILGKEHQNALCNY